MLSVRKIGILAMAAVFALVASACEKKQEKSTAGQQAVPVTTTSAISVDIPFSATFIGKATAYDNVGVLARVQGFLKKRAFVEGDFVKKGTLLFAIEDDQYKAALDQAKASLSQAEAAAVNASVQFERAKELIKTGDVSRSVFDTRETAYLSSVAAVKAARAAVETASLNLGYTKIAAPFSGKIGMATYSEGEYITPSSGSLVDLVSIDPMGVIFAVSTQDLVGLYNMGGDFPKVYASLVNAKGKEYGTKGEVDFINNAVNPLTDTLKMRAKFANPKGALLDGAIVNVKITTEEDYPTIVIPQAALQQDQAGRYVMVINNNNKAVLTRVVTGRELKSFIVVNSGLSAGDQIVIEGLQKIKQDTLVAPVLQQPKMPTQEDISGDNTPAAKDSATKDKVSAATTTASPAKKK